jgi:hypothetical protein
MLLEELAPAGPLAFNRLIEPRGAMEPDRMELVPLECFVALIWAQLDAKPADK